MRGWARWAIGLIIIWIAIFTAHNLFGTSWSNHCDPGNAQFNLLKSDPVVSFHAEGELVTWENDGPDNSWLCSDASLSLSYIGDPSTLYPEIKANITASGWTELGGAYVSDADASVFQKDVAGGGVRLNAIVRKQLVWAEVDMNAPGLHPGENGFT